MGENETSARRPASASDAQDVLRFAALDPTLGDVIRRLGSVGAPRTLSGTLADGSPIAALAPCLMALGACVELRQGKERRTLPFEEFFLAHERQDLRTGEFVTSVTAPPLGEHEQFCLRTVVQDLGKDFSRSVGAFKFEIRDGRVGSARIAFGLEDKPARALTTEAFAIGLRLADEATWRGALDAISLDFPPIGDERASPASRAVVARELLRSALLELRGTLGSVVD